MKQKIVKLSVLVGLVILALMIYTIGPNHIWQNLKKITWQNLLILVVLRILYWLLRTINWKIILDEYKGNTSLADLFIARMAGHAVSQLTPAAQVGSETTRILIAGCSNKRIITASVIVDKTIEFFSTITFVVIGLVFLLMRIALPLKLKIYFIGGAALAVSFILFIFYKQQKGILDWLRNLLYRLKIRFKFLEKHRGKIEEIDKHISRFYSQHKPAFLKTYLLYGLLMMLWITEVHLNLLFIGVSDISFVESFLITVMGTLACLFSFIPASLGIYEITYVGVFALLGRGTAVGLTLVLIRRIIGYIMAGIGLFGLLKPMPPRKKKEPSASD